MREGRARVGLAGCRSAQGAVGDDVLQERACAARGEEDIACPPTKRRMQHYLDSRAERVKRRSASNNCRCRLPCVLCRASGAAAAELERLREENEALRAALLAMRNEFLPEELREGTFGGGSCW